MESSKLKNIVLTILVITNILLLGLVMVQRENSRRHRQQALDDAVALLARQGITLRADTLPDEDLPAPMALERDTQWELETMTDLLGQGTTLTQRGLVSLYNGPLGSAELRPAGGLLVTLEPGSYPLAQGQDKEDHALALVRRLGADPQVIDRDDRGVTAVQLCPGSKAPVFSCAVRVDYEADGSIRMEGTRLVGEPSRDSQHGQVLSIATMLVRFRAGVIESGDACTAILSVTQGYTLSADANGNLRLIPVLRLETDTNLYTVNALTGELSRVGRG